MEDKANSEEAVARGGEGASGPGYQLFMLALCLYSLVGLAVQSFVALDPEVRTLLSHADNAICAIFLADFLYSLWRAPDRLRYFVTWGWIDLLSSIPMLDAARWGRLARVLRLLRVLRGIRATRHLTEVLLQRRAENGLLAACLAAILLMIVSSIAVLQVETGPGTNIATANDALWWAFTTVTTVGYGDRFPVTSDGRLVAAFLMIAGVGMFGTISAFLATWFMRPVATKRADEIVALRTEIAALREVVERLAEKKGD